MNIETEKQLTIYDFLPEGCVPYTEHITAYPIELKQANAYVAKYHRHHKPSVRDKFRVAAILHGEIVGVVNVGRPISRGLSDGYTLEVLRLCTNGEKNVCSFLYSKAARIAKEMGYRKIITYILDSESGTSLKATGWKLEAENVGGYMEHPFKAENRHSTYLQETEMVERFTERRKT